MGDDRLGREGRHLMTTDPLAPLEPLRQDVAASLSRTSAPRVVDAGCGSAIHIDLPDDAVLIGLDISQTQLDRNPKLAERICADLQTADLSGVDADLVVIWDVLEHIERPMDALDRLVAALKPGGLLLIAGPDPRSVKGLTTKLSPHWFHVWFYRTVYGIKTAGQADTRPFRTHMRMAVSPRPLERWARDRGLTTVRTITYEGETQSRLMRQHRVLGALYAAVGALAVAASLGTLSFRRTEFATLLRAPEAQR